MSEIEDLLVRLAPIKNVTLATLVGRYYAMDRDNRWERVQAAYELLYRGELPRWTNTVDPQVEGNIDF